MILMLRSLIYFICCIMRTRMPTCKVSNYKGPSHIESWHLPAEPNSEELKALVIFGVCSHNKD